MGQALSMKLQCEDRVKGIEMTSLNRDEIGRLVIQPPLFNELMSKHTTFRVGGPAECLLSVVDERELCRVLEYAQDHSLPIFMLGRGSNLLVREQGIKGLVIKLDGDFKRWYFKNGFVTAGAGSYLPMLIENCATFGLGGLEAGVGVPGTVGGALASNCGSATAFIGAKVVETRVVGVDGCIKVLSSDDMGFDYRSSRIPEIGWLLDVTFRLERQDPPSIKQCIREMLKSRNKAQPVNQPSAGCIFKNSSGDHASRLLDTAGVKGKRVGAAEFSMKHANFIVNLGGACASDVLDLASQARDLVYGRHGVSLDYEVRVVGE